MLKNGGLNDLQIILKEYDIMALLKDIFQVLIKKCKVWNAIRLIIIRFNKHK